MAAGRRSGDPTDLLLVDPSQPEATRRERKHLTKRQKDIFIQYGFTKALLLRRDHSRLGSSGHQQLCPLLQQPSGNKAGHACTWSRHEYEEGN